MRSKLFSLWGQGAEAADKKPAETDEEKAAREKSEKDTAAKKKAEEDEAKAAAARAAAAESGDDDDEDDEEDDDDDEDEDDDDDDDDEKKKATKAAAAAVPKNVARFIRRAERKRLHAIVDGAGPDRVAAALNVALNSNMAAKPAIAMLMAMPAGDAAAGRLGLRGSMAGRPTKPLGMNGDTPHAPAGEADKAVASILLFASNAKAAPQA